jgi:hypothetical protein
MKCSNCGSTSNPIVDADVTGPISVCVNCYSDQQIVEKHRKKFIKCDNCGCGLPPNQAVDTPKGKLCRDCSVNYSKCKNYDDCHSYLHAYTNDEFCESCRSNMYIHICTSCGNPTGKSYDDRGRCHRCQDDETKYTHYLCSTPNCNNVVDEFFDIYDDVQLCFSCRMKKSNLKS